MMEFNIESLKRAVERTRKELEAAVNLKGATDANIEHLLASYRSASEDLIFHDFAFASSLDTEKYLWNWHTKVNNRFRETLKYFQEGEGKKKAVERRKSERQFIVFIKSSQSFYRAFIQRLASHFANVAEVVEVARKITADILPLNRPAAVEGVQKQLVLHSCHSSLVQLGDLSRYRETVLQSKDKNWGPAKGYYRLATAVLPTSGAPFHQLAVIAQADRDAFGTTYFFYRALMQPELNLNAQVNLEKHFKKIREHWDDPESHNVKDGLFKTFQSRFVAFHAKCYSGVLFDEHRDLETEMIHEISVTLLQRPDTNLWSKICLTNIAAETSALERLGTKCTLKKCAGCQRNHPDSSCAQYLFSLQAFHSFQSFNIKLASQLLRGLIAELQRIKKLIESSEMEEDDKLTPIVRCLLPVLRQYSSWLLAEVPFLVVLDSQPQDSDPPSAHSNLVGITQDLWRNYVDALAALATTYPVKGGKRLNYLLAEDEETVAFKPFADDLVRTRYLNEAGELRARSTDPLIVKEEPAEEMLHRVRQIVKDGINIAKNTVSLLQHIFRIDSPYVASPCPLLDYSLPGCWLWKHVDSNHFVKKKERMVPVRLKEGRFIYVQPDSSLREPGSEGQRAASGIVIESTTEFQPLAQAPGQATPLVSMDSVMQDMVDDLVEERHPTPMETDRPISQHIHSTSPRNETFTAADLVKQIQRSSQNPASQSLHTSTFGSSSLPSGLQDSAAMSGPARSSQLFKTPAHQLRASHDNSLTEQLIRQQQEIQARSSPVKSIPQPSSWSYYETPTGLNSLLNAQRSPSGSPVASREMGYEEVRKQLPRKNLFGAIGETPGRTPTSAQPN